MPHLTQTSSESYEPGLTQLGNFQLHDWVSAKVTKRDRIQGQIESFDPLDNTALIKGLDGKEYNEPLDKIVRIQ